jgi:uncharacterized repeat protein (TIGR01451 family)
VTATPTLPAASADLQVRQSSIPDPAVPGGSLLLVITVENAGPSAAEDVVLEDALPGVVSFLGSSPLWPETQSPLTWRLGSVAAGASSVLVLNLTVSADANGSLASVARVTSSTADGNSGNNVSALYIVVAPQ